MAPTTPQDPTLSVVSKKWDAANKGFLTDEERALRNLDTEGTGTLSSKQLSSFADQYAALRKENKQIKRGLAGLTLLTVLLFVGTVVASVLAAQASRDTATDPMTGVMMASGTNSPVSVNNNEIPLPVAALPFLPPDVVAHVKYVSFSGPAKGDKDNFHRTVGAIDTVASTSLVITTTTGDKVTWPGADGDEGRITVTLADGTSWTKGAACTECVATNVLATEENQRGIDAFQDRLDAHRESGTHRRLAALCHWTSPKYTCDVNSCDVNGNCDYYAVNTDGSQGCRLCLSADCGCDICCNDCASGSEPHCDGDFDICSDFDDTEDTCANTCI